MNRFQEQRSKSSWLESCSPCDSVTSYPHHALLPTNIEEEELREDDSGGQAAVHSGTKRRFVGETLEYEAYFGLLTVLHRTNQCGAEFITLPFASQTDINSPQDPVWMEQD